MTMKWERRKKSLITAPEGTPGPLPVDFVRLVEETLTQGLEEGLTSIREIHPESKFHAGGAIYENEILLAITLSQGPSQISATTVFGSADYDPNAEKPALVEILSACLDAAGSVFQHYLDPEYPERITQIADQSLSALEEAPFQWSSIRPENHPKIEVHVKIDKSNPVLDALTEDWLRKNDPNYREEAEKSPDQSHREAEDFLEERLDAIQGRKGGKGGSTPPGLH
jgi:hypothetical protein